MKWMVVGGCGFLGSALVERLASEGAKVAVLDNLAGPGSRARADRLAAMDGVSVEFGDTGAEREMRRYVAEHASADALAFVSGQVSMTTSLEDPRADMECNFLGAFNILEAMRAVSFGGAAVMASTNKVYGAQRGKSDEGIHRYIAAPVGEREPLDFCTPYGCSKGAADQYWRDYAATYGLRTVVLRHSSMYGPGQIGEVGHGWVAWFIARARERAASISISGDGKQVRDLLHVSDAARAYLAAVVHIDACEGRVFNVGGGQANSMSIVELLRWLCDETGWFPPIVHGPWRLADQRSFISDNAAFNAATGWWPLVSATDGLRELLRG